MVDNRPDPCLRQTFQNRTSGSRERCPNGANVTLSHATWSLGARLWKFAQVREGECRRPREQKEVPVLKW